VKPPQAARPASRYPALLCGILPPSLPPSLPSLCTRAYFVPARVRYEGVYSVTSVELMASLACACACVARGNRWSVASDGLVKEPRGKSRRYLCISFLICVCARAFPCVYVQRVVCCYLCARTQTQTHTCMHREVKNALVEASKQGLVKIVSDDGSLARTPGIITRYRAHTQTLLGLICHTLTVKFDVSLCVLRERVHTNHTKKRTQTNKQVSRLELKCNLPSVPLHPPPPLFLQSW
jgi:hypothetical protein